MSNKHYSTIADTTLHHIECLGDRYFLVSDNKGENGIVYQLTDTIGHPAADYPPYAEYREDGWVYWKNHRMGRGYVKKEILPDSLLEGYSRLKRNPKAIYRMFGENN